MMHNMLSNGGQRISLWSVCTFWYWCSASAITFWMAELTTDMRKAPHPYCHGCCAVPMPWPACVVRQDELCLSRAGCDNEGGFFFDTATSAHSCQSQRRPWVASKATHHSTFGNASGCTAPYIQAVTSRNCAFNWGFVRSHRFLGSVIDYLQ